MNEGCEVGLSQALLVVLAARRTGEQRTALPNPNEKENYEHPIR